MSVFKDEEIVHAPRKTGKYMNKVSLLEGGDRSPPFRRDSLFASHGGRTLNISFQNQNVNGYFDLIFLPHSEC